ncbi:site-specific DNA-methyltransferase [uncultured Paraglaciecola sp.]|uniref:DNA-methyltransferase n=1 Tax=uncultured Paraglaciecola sp. TaxID=1765024 RepID=UPI0026192405|nr:site-specific DNA-methyltransferase [uncultured Paraglaciecola sp.]
MINLINDDCLKAMAEMDDCCIDLTVTSPPYDNLRTYKDSLEWGEHVWKPILEQLYRVTKKGGVVVWVVGDATIKGSETGTSFRQALYAVECGFNVETMIWEKTGSGCLGSNKYYGQNFEYMFIFAKGQPKTTNLIKDRENKVKSGTVKVNGGLDKEGKGKTRTVERKPLGKRNNIWRFDTQKNSDHPAPFPSAMVNDHIISWSNEGDTVLDPFMGSGTTGKMAKMNNRDFIGIEKVEEYFKIAQDRISAT